MVLQILNNGELMNHNNSLQERIMFVVNLIRSPSRTKKKQKKNKTATGDESGHNTKLFDHEKNVSEMCWISFSIKRVAI